ncbi:MAG: 3-deoxy-manno-octulosonate cytidylyltransferase [Candidatus Omnitrophica bacterium]|nr:3-deoxy-manno-octulosonate cytidylyltransferase [Candidatus Omnitrophota bacterium]
MKTVGVIPARFQSTRFPGKVLALIHGKPMIELVWRQAQKCEQLDELWIACDHPDVYGAAVGFGAQAVMTSPDHPSGSDRIAEVVGKMSCDLVVNIQGDEPFIQPEVIDRLVAALKEDSQSSMATVIKEIYSQEDLVNPNVVKVVIDHKQYAMYFSRSSIPYNRNAERPQGLKYFKHLGLYAYRKSFLMEYKDWPKSVLESTEQLEQLRVLEAGYKIRTILTDKESLAVDTPEDLERILKSGITT